MEYKIPAFVSQPSECHLSSPPLVPFRGRELIVQCFNTFHDLIQLSFVTSHAKTFLAVCRFETDSHSSAVRTVWAICSRKLWAIRRAWAIHSKKCEPFERLELSVQKIVSHSNGLSYPFKKNCEPFKRLELSVQKKLWAVRTGQAICSKKIGYCKECFRVRGHIL